MQELSRWLSDMNLGHPLTIAGPCSAESEMQTLKIAEQLVGSRATVFRAGVWKPRTRPGSFEGMGEVALPWLVKVKKEFGFQIAIEVANVDHIKKALDHDIDILWIGARTTVNPFAVQDIAEALQDTEKIIWVKNPINPDLELWIGAVERLFNSGIKNIGVIHRGFSSYNATNYRNPPNWQIPIDFRRRHPEIPMICDPSHICGRRDTIEKTAQTALDLKFDGLMIETHFDPDHALSDANQQVTPKVFREIIHRLIVRQKQFSELKYNEQLATLRAEIDSLDVKLIEMLNSRMKIVEEIGMAKRSNNVAVLQEERYTNILNRMIEHGTRMGLSFEFINSIFENIHMESIRIQENIYDKNI